MGEFLLDSFGPVTEADFQFGQDAGSLGRSFEGMLPDPQNLPTEGAKIPSMATVSSAVH